jgi:hypothetical protein
MYVAHYLLMGSVLYVGTQKDFSNPTASMLGLFTAIEIIVSVLKIPSASLVS